MAWGSSQEATAVLVAVNYFQAHGMLVSNTSGEILRTITEEAGKSITNLLHYSYILYDRSIINKKMYNTLFKSGISLEYYNQTLISLHCRPRILLD